MVIIMYEVIYNLLLLFINTHQYLMQNKILNTNIFFNHIFLLTKRLYCDINPAS